MKKKVCLHLEDLSEKTAMLHILNLSNLIVSVFLTFFRTGRKENVGSPNFSRTCKQTKQEDCWAEGIVVFGYLTSF